MHRQGQATIAVVTEISDALVDLEMLPIQDIPQQPKSAQEVLMVASLLLELPREPHASSTVPWD
jgi:hypothetical protein